jgi:hypothetical protein
MESFLRDICHALRLFRKAGAGFILTAVLTLAAGVGANTAIFSLINTVLLREPSFPRANRIVIFETKTAQGSFQGASPAEFAHWAKQTDVVEEVAAFGGGVVNWTGFELPLQLRSERVSAAYFGLFGVPILLGRAFNAQEDTPGAAPVAVIGESLWRRQFAGDAHVLGRTMNIEGTPHVIVGVVSILTMRMSLSGSAQARSSAGIEQMIRNATQRLDAIPGVQLASTACCIPLEGGYNLPFRIMGRPLNNGPFHGGGGWKTVLPGFFEVFKIRILRGRSFTERDNHGGAPVVIINETMTQRFWPKSDPLRDRILIGKGLMPQLQDEPPRQIIGIAADQRDGALNQNPQPEMYIPNGQATDAIQALNVQLTPLAWVIRTRGNPMRLSKTIEEQLRQATGLPVTDIRTMDEVVSRSTSRQRFQMLLMTAFAGVSLMLAAIGIYGLMAYSVEQRTQEIGIRMALGGSQNDIRSMILRQGLTLAAIGIALGTGGALLAARQITSFLFGVTAWDPEVFVLIPALLLVIATLAAWQPAVRATRVEPAVALRHS